MKNMGLKITMIFSGVVLVFGYMNCTKKVDFLSQFEQSSSSSDSSVYDCLNCQADQDDEQVYLSLNSANQVKQKQVIHSRQVIDNLYHAFNLNPSLLDTNVKDKLYEEKSDRFGILIQENASDKLTVINTSSLVSLSGEICRAYVSHQIMQNTIIGQIDLSKKIDEVNGGETVSIEKWLSVTDEFAKKLWSRTLTIQEKTHFKTYIEEFLAEAKVNQTYGLLNEGRNFSSMNLFISICTAVSSMPESIQL